MGDAEKGSHTSFIAFSLSRVAFFIGRFSISSKIQSLVHFAQFAAENQFFEKGLSCAQLGSCLLWCYKFRAFRHGCIPG
jgi:hypothetical protein